MTLKTTIKNILPSPILKRIRLQKEWETLGKIQRSQCDTANLRHINDISLNDIFSSYEIESMWLSSEKKIKNLSISNDSGGVNKGDRRAIYYLISDIKPISVLEIGTHIGASTIHIASALEKNYIANGINAKLTTVDITDVNSSAEKPWLKHGTIHSPIEMLSRLGYESFVEFVTDTSLNFMANCESKFDFVFLDGDHSAKSVYQEIPNALNLINKNGVVLLHDYFPGLKPLWSNGSLLPGPFLASKKLMKEGLNIAVLPLGKLPWSTKMRSHFTSLALLLRT